MKEPSAEKVLSIVQNVPRLLLIFSGFSLQRQELRRGSSVIEAASSYLGCLQKYTQYLVPFQKLGKKNKRWDNMFLLSVLSYRSLIVMGKEMIFLLSLL